VYDLRLERAECPAQDDGSMRPRTVAGLLEEQARMRGEVIALAELDLHGAIARRWTFLDLKRDCEKLARAMSRRHGPGARIAIYANNVPEWVLVELAAPLAGLTLVTVNPSYGARELAYVLAQSRAEAVYHADVVRGVALAPVIAAATKDLPGVAAIRLADHDAMFEGAAEGEVRATRPTDPIQIQYTSGTTGFPKGALLHQHGLIQNGHDLCARWGLQPGDRILHFMPLFHTAGCAILVLGGYSHGASIVLAPAFEPELLARVIAREKIDAFFGVPTMIVGLIDAAQAGGIDVSCVRLIMSGGAMVAPELVRKGREAFGATIQIVYGQTETSPAITATWRDDADADLSGTIGQPLPHVDVSIRSTVDGSVCAVGEQGEICCRGYLLMTGYNDNPEATRATIDEDGWLHTGDLGAMDARGYVRITGRVKDMIIRGGENLFPAEIENAMLEHEEILECAVVGMPDEKWGEQAVCFMRLRGAERPTAQALKAFIRARLSPQKTPAYWVFVEAWPLTGSGKIQKFALREALARGEHELHVA